MDTKKQMFQNLLEGNFINNRVLFRPILMYFAARLIGKTYGEFASDYGVLVEANLRAIDKFDIDMAGLISDPYRETSAFGAPVRFIPDGVPVCEKIIIRSADDVRTLKNPDVYKSSRTLDRIKAAEALASSLKGDVPIIGWIEGPLAEACDLAGVSEMLQNLMIDPDFSNALMDKCLITAKSFARAQVEAGCDIIGIGDAICSQIDPITYSSFVKDRHIELIDYIHSIGAKVKLHICGNIIHILHDIKDTAPDILDVDWIVDLDHAREIMGNQTILCGNINPVTIQDQTPEMVKEISGLLVKKYRNSRYILSAGCEITVNTPHENILAMRHVSYF